MDSSVKGSEIVEILRRYKNGLYFQPKYGIYVDSTPCYIGDAKLYKSEGLAIRSIVGVSPVGTTKEDIKELINQGLIEIRKIE